MYGKWYCVPFVVSLYDRLGIHCKGLVSNGGRKIFNDFEHFFQS